MATDMKIIKKSYDLSKWLFGHTAKFPKSHRFSIAVRLETLALEFLEKLLIANRRTNKLPLLLAADEHLFRERLLVRFSYEMKFINLQSYEFAASELDEIGRMLGGWIKQQSEAKRGEA